MSVTFYKELNALSRAKKVISILPQRLRLRVAKKLYNYEAPGIHGIDIVVPLQDKGLVCFINSKDLIGWKIFFLGEYEHGTNKVLAAYVKKGDIVIEAGANIGSETLLLSRLVGDQGTVYGFEPNPYTFERLGINVVINSLQNVNIFDCAIGEADSSISFNIYPKDFCNPGMSSKYMETPLTQKITVAQKKLDTFIKEQNISRVNFLKMDIQGAEMDMIMGASETIAAHKPTIFLEAEDVYNDTQALYQLLTGYGYSIYVIGQAATERIKTHAEVRNGNWLAIFGNEPPL